MAYGTTAGIDAKFGPNNVIKWADLDNDRNSLKIAARKAAAIVAVDAEIDALLCNTHYRKPLITATGAVPLVIADIANTLAGCWLKDARGQTTFNEQGSPADSLNWLRTKAYDTINKIKSGDITLDAL